MEESLVTVNSWKLMKQELITWQDLTHWQGERKGDAIPAMGFYATLVVRSSEGAAQIECDWGNRSRAG